MAPEATFEDVETGNPSVTRVEIPLTDDELRELEAAEHVLTKDELQAANLQALRVGTAETARQVTDLKAALDAGLDDPAGKRLFKKGLKQAASDTEFDLQTIDEMLAESESDELRAIRDSAAETADKIAELQGAAGISVAVQVPHLPLSDVGNAEHFGLMYEDIVRYDHARRRWLVWDAHH
jgi:hypothetical protein